MSDNIFKSVSDIRRILVQDYFSSESILNIIAKSISDMSSTNVIVENGVIKVLFNERATASAVEDAIRSAIVLFLQNNKADVLRSLISVNSKDIGQVFADILTHTEWVYDIINMNSSMIIRF